MNPQQRRITISKVVVARILHWLGGPISAVVGVAATWLYTQFPAVSSFIGPKDSVAKAIVEGAVFLAGAGLTWLSHNAILTHIVEDLEGNATTVSNTPSFVIPTNPQQKPESLPTSSVQVSSK